MGFSSKQKIKLAMNVRNSAFNILLGQKWHEYLCLWSIRIPTDVGDGKKMRKDSKR